MYHSKTALRTCSKGFTLIEVVVAIAILAGIIAISSLVWSNNMRRLKKAEQIETVTLLLEKKMKELEVTYKNANINDLPSEDNGNFPTYPDYTWKFETRSFQLPSSSVLLKIYNVPENEMNSYFSSLLKQALEELVVELKLTVSYRKKTRASQYSLSTYFVNYANFHIVLSSLSSEAFQQIQGLNYAPE